MNFFRQIIGTVFLLSKLIKAKKWKKKLVENPDFKSIQDIDKLLLTVYKGIVWTKGIRITITGKENIPQKASVICSNNQSPFDAIIISSIFEYNCTSFLVKENSVNKKVNSLLGAVKLLGCVIFIDQDQKSDSAMILKSIKKTIIDLRKTMIVFPEKKMSSGKKVNTFQPGILQIGYDCYTPIIPTAIKGTDALVKKGSKNRDIEIVFHKPVIPQRFLNMQRTHLTEIIQRTVKEELKKEKKLFVKPSKNKKTNNIKKRNAKKR